MGEEEEDKRSAPVYPWRWQRGREEKREEEWGKEWEKKMKNEKREREEQVVLGRMVIGIGVRREERRQEKENNNNI